MPTGETGDMLTFGQLLRLTLNLWYALPAFSSGFSVRPPPATCPTIARHVLGSTCIASRKRGIAMSASTRNHIPPAV